MKRLTAIFFFFLFLFNLVGYRLFFKYAEQKAVVRIENQILTEQYQNSDLLRLEVDMNMPYLTADTDYESINGEITVDDKIYTFVKRKVKNGKLVLLCLPDHDKTRLRTAQNDFFKNANSLNHQNDTEKSTKSLSKAPLPEYEQHLASFNISCETLRSDVTSYDPATMLFPKHSITPEQPPEII